MNQISYLLINQIADLLILQRTSRLKQYQLKKIKKQKHINSMKEVKLLSARYSIPHISSIVAEDIVKTSVSIAKKRQFLFKNMNKYSVAKLTKLIQQINEQQNLQTNKNKIKGEEDPQNIRFDNLISASDRYCEHDNSLDPKSLSYNEENSSKMHSFRDNEESGRMSNFRRQSTRRKEDTRRTSQRLSYKVIQNKSKNQDFYLNIMSIARSKRNTIVSFPENISPIAKQQQRPSFAKNRKNSFVNQRKRQSKSQQKYYELTPDQYYPSSYNQDEEETEYMKLLRDQKQQEIQYQLKIRERNLKRAPIKTEGKYLNFDFQGNLTAKKKSEFQVQQKFLQTVLKTQYSEPEQKKSFHSMTFKERKQILMNKTVKVSEKKNITQQQQDRIQKQLEKRNKKVLSLRVLAEKQEIERAKRQFKVEFSQNMHPQIIQNVKIENEGIKIKIGYDILQKQINPFEKLMARPKNKNKRMSLSEYKKIKREEESRKHSFRILKAYYDDKRHAKTEINEQNQNKLHFEEKTQVIFNKNSHTNFSTVTNFHQNPTLQIKVKNNLLKDEVISEIKALQQYDYLFVKQFQLEEVKEKEKLREVLQKIQEIEREKVPLNHIDRYNLAYVRCEGKIDRIDMEKITKQIVETSRKTIQINSERKRVSFALQKNKFKPQKFLRNTLKLELKK